jgi:DNA-binding Lrp family transcriptional regulator
VHSFNREVNFFVNSRRVRHENNLRDDKRHKILRETGTKKCDVTRSTVYRRVTNLEKEKIITRQIRVALDFEKIGLVAINFGLNLEPKDEENAVATLKKMANVKMIWRSYGSHNIVLLVFCQKGEEGKTIDKMRRIFEELAVTSFDTCVGYSGEKTDMTLF